ncbi:MAG TPA: ribosome maturation factor RimM [Acidimicrobiales bacterium]
MTVLLEVGRVAKAHGVKGEVVVVLTTDRAERVAPGAVLQTDRGELVVQASRPHQDRHLVLFEGVFDRTAAEALAGLVLRAEPIDDPDALWVHELVGTLVVEVGGTERGRVAAVIANPAHDLLELDSGALVPMPFVVDVADGVTTIAVPDGLFDL